MQGPGLHPGLIQGQQEGGGMAEGEGVKRRLETSKGGRRKRQIEALKATIRGFFVCLFNVWVVQDDDLIYI